MDYVYVLINLNKISTRFQIEILHVFHVFTLNNSRHFTFEINQMPTRLVYVCRYFQKHNIIKNGGTKNTKKKKKNTTLLRHTHIIAIIIFQGLRNKTTEKRFTNPVRKTPKRQIENYDIEIVRVTTTSGKESIITRRALKYRLRLIIGPVCTGSHGWTVTVEIMAAIIGI